MAWQELVVELLKEITDFSEIEKLEEEVAERACFIHHHHSGTYDTIFKPKVARYLPTYNSGMEAKYKGIIGQPKA